MAEIENKRLEEHRNITSEVSSSEAPTETLICYGRSDWSWLR